MPDIITGATIARWRTLDRRHGTDDAQRFLDWLIPLAGVPAESISSSSLDGSELRIVIYAEPKRLNEAGDDVEKHVKVILLDHEPPVWPPTLALG